MNLQIRVFTYLIFKTALSETFLRSHGALVPTVLGKNLVFYAIISSLYFLLSDKSNHPISVFNLSMETGRVKHVTIRATW